jgi:GxxExxY protein
MCHESTWHIGEWVSRGNLSAGIRNEMKKAGLRFVRELEMNIYYDGEEIGKRRVDFFVEDVIMVELKAIITLEEVHLAQAMNYVEAYKMEIGLLINFGSRSLQFKRVHNNKIA